jgi:hypothetical protein
VAFAILRQRLGRDRCWYNERCRRAGAERQSIATRETAARH